MPADSDMELLAKHAILIAEAKKLADEAKCLAIGAMTISLAFAALVLAVCGAFG